MSRAYAIILYMAVAGGVLASDLWTKDSVFRYLCCEVTKDEQRGEPNVTDSHPKPIIRGWLDLEAVVNTGAFNGWFKDHPTLLTVVSVVAVVAISLIVAFPGRASALLPIALGMLAGGALGNLYDRVNFLGVRDFIKVYRGDWVWPNFNLADSAICVGVGMLFLRELILWRRSKATPAAAAIDTHPIAEEAAAEETPAP